MVLFLAAVVRRGEQRSASVVLFARIRALRDCFKKGSVDDDDHDDGDDESAAYECM